ncbi:MAG: PqqD family protein [Thermoanaerobaculia bacterium]
MRRSRKDPLGEINLLELAPVRVARWQQVEDRVVVDRPKPHARFPRILLEWLSHLMAVKSLRLDEVGSFAWQLLDGEHTVGQVAVAVRERFGDAVEPAEERLGHLVRLLRQEGLLAYPEWDPVPDLGQEDGLSGQK